jgi:hypothetical protein
MRLLPVQAGKPVVLGIRRSQVRQLTSVETYLLTRKTLGSRAEDLGFRGWIQDNGRNPAHHFQPNRLSSCFCRATGIRPCL